MKFKHYNWGHTMKIIRYGLLGCALLLGSTAQAANCKVTYKAKKIQIDRFLFQDVENLKYRSGTLTGKGTTQSQCKKNALRKITKNNWTVTYAAVTMI